MLPKINLIKSQDFHDAWSRAIYFVLEHGTPITFGDSKDPKSALDSCQLIELTGNALEQIKDGWVPIDFNFSGKRLQEYCGKFTREHLVEYNSMPEDTRATYIYFDRIANYHGVDQCKIMKEELQAQIDSGIVSNRTRAITWMPEKDATSTEPPCLQSLQIRYVDDGLVDLHLSWRSRDLAKALPANLVAISDMLYREVLDPCNCKIARIVDFSDSLHIYDADIEDAKKVRVNPMYRNH